MESSIISAEGAHHSLHPLYMDYIMLADLFVYPENEKYREKIKEIYAYLLNVLPECAETLQPFFDFTEASSLREIQELFLRSFDVQAITTLDIGFVLFGEDYKRGKLLVHLNEEHRKAGNDCHTELSDHLPNLLHLIAKMKDEEIRSEIGTLLLIPAVEKMADEFSFEKIEKKDVVYKKHQKVLLDYSADYRTVYQSCLRALSLALTKDFGGAAEAEPLKNNSPSNTNPNIPGMNAGDNPIKDFSQNIETEILTEK